MAQDRARPDVVGQTLLLAQALEEPAGRAVSENVVEHEKLDHPAVADRRAPQRRGARAPDPCSLD